jgi:hypothetical protein
MTRVHFLAGAFLFVTMPRLVLKPTQPPIKWTPVQVFSSGTVSRIWSWPLDEVKNMWSYTSKFPYAFHGMVLSTRTAFTTSALFKSTDSMWSRCVYMTVAFVIGWHYESSRSLTGRHIIWLVHKNWKTLSSGYFFLSLLLWLVMRWTHSALSWGELRKAE